MMTKERVHQRRGQARRIKAVGLPIALILSGCASMTPWTKRSERVALPPSTPHAPRNPVALNPPIPESPPKPDSPTLPDPRSLADNRPAPIVPPIERPIPPEPRVPTRTPAPELPPTAEGLPPADSSVTPIAVKLEPRSGPAPGRASRPAPAAPTAAPQGATPDPIALVKASEDRLAAVGSYRVRMTRQERVGSTLGDQEEIILSVRTRPQALRMEWPSGSQAGREVLYQPEGGDGQVHIRMGKNGLVPPLTLAPDNPMIAKSSRHGIGDAGIEGILRGLRRDLTIGKATAGTIRAESGTPIGPNRIPCDVIVRDSPEGEHWIVAFDPQTSLPLLVEGKDARGQLLERYTFQGIQFNLPDLAKADAFDPAKRWPSPGASLLGAFTGAKD